MNSSNKLRTGKISMIASIGRNREIGKGPDLIWPIPDDLRRFKEITSGHPIIMGKNTYDSIGRPLPNRQNIVISRDPDLKIANVDTVIGIEEAIKIANGDEVFIIGGGQIYTLGLPFADKLYMTLVDAQEPNANTFFPEFEEKFTKKTLVEERNFEGLKYSWVNFEKS